MQNWMNWMNHAKLDELDESCKISKVNLLDARCIADQGFIYFKVIDRQWRSDQ